ncbi:MAG: hypothetical protein ACOY0S_01935 [Patescibacteria group bacterium]
MRYRGVSLKFLSLTPILGVVFWVAWPLLAPGFIPTHDGEYHLMRFWQIAKMWRFGYLFPRWAPDLNSGYGVPLFNFFYPLPSYIGAFYHLLGWSLVDAFKLTLATGYLAAGLFCFWWLNKLFSRSATVFGVVMFMLTPYWFVEVYVRGTVGEVLAIAWLMLALGSIEAGAVWSLGLASAGLVLSHNILAMVFLPILIGYIFLKKLSLVKGLVLGLGLSAYFWLPAVIEKGTVVGTNFVNFRDYFPQVYQLLLPSWGTGFFGSSYAGNEMSVQIGVIPILIVISGIVAGFSERLRRFKKLSNFFIVLGALSIFLMLPISRYLWEKIPALAYLQYSWRLLALFLPIVAYMASYLFQKIRQKWLWLLIILTLVFVYPYFHPVVYPIRDDRYYLSQREFTDGTSSLGDSFTTRWLPPQRERPRERVEIISGKTRLISSEMKPLEYNLLFSSELESKIRLHTAYYPGWTVRLDGRITDIEFAANGLISFAVPAGEHRVWVRFEETPLRQWANIVSLISLLWLITSGILKGYANRARHDASLHKA